jgi:hypothetical protein
MSTSISSSFTVQYEKDAHEAFQRNGSRFKSAVRFRDGVVGASTIFQKIGKGVATTKARHGTITPMNQDHTPITCTLADFYAGDWVDRLDEAKTNIDERKLLASGGAKALGRKVDAQILTALDGTSNDAATVVVTSDAAVLNGMIIVAETAMTLDSFEEGMMYGVMSPRMWSRMMRLKQFSDADYVGSEGMEFAKSAPVAQRWKFWYGIMWTSFSGLPGGGTSASKGFIWNKSAVGFAAGAHPANLASVSGEESSVGADITWHGDRGAHFVNHAMSGGACLIDDAGVIGYDSNDTTALATS